MSLYNKTFGQKGENIASQYLIDSGFIILSRNFRSKFGEIDIIAKKDSTIYFIEVKTRSNITKGFPYESVTKHKILRLRNTALYFLSKNGYTEYKYSIAAISVVIEKTGQYNIQFFDSINR